MRGSGPQVARLTAQTGVDRRIERAYNFDVAGAGADRRPGGRGM